ncbi:MAG: PhoH family protein [Smithellaceae bacterium]|jgi:PhoH-like ATPase|nr:PhoH family protein [Smithellaceae bacterium]MDD3259096.1 PhoH family protein [Smithellaceae bacterium]MDD3849461.1 PhoH family protein [Smithellaceae bacterium]HPL10409.1 PhoH family protein [Smithellaceae bacterium]
MMNGKKGKAQAEKKRATGEANKTPEKYFVVDTSALEYGIDVFEKLRQGGRNCVLMPYATWEELDSHKTGNDFKADIARSVIRNVRNLFRAQDRSVRFFSYDFTAAKDGGLKTDKNDHCIIATALHARQKLPAEKVILVTQDAALETLALNFGMEVQSVKMDETEVKEQHAPRITVNLQKQWIADKTFPLKLPEARLADKLGQIRLNEGIVCYCERDGAWGPAFAAVRKGDHFRIVDKDIHLLGVRPRSNNGEVNWGQYIAMDLLRDASVPLVALTGKAGTAKTFLSLLAAFEQASRYRRILVSRATIQLGNKDRLGYSPGDIDAKMKPWMHPIYDNINAIKELVDDKMKEKINEWLTNGKIEMMDLDKIRGRSIQKCFVIVDEIQNLPPSHVKAIATRGGEGTKMVFTGDFSHDQIDVPWLDERSNGLSVLNARMAGSRLFGSVHLDQAIRSELTKEILERW